MNIKNINVNKKKIMALLTACALSGSLVGCSTEMVAPNSYDTIDTNTDIDSLEDGLRQEVDVPEENFKLLIDYNCNLEDGENWTITGDKSLITTIKTDGLPDGYKVFIDNVHTDTSIVATSALFNGVIQDSMDDRIHTSLLVGFPISDDVDYIGENEIEGQNDSFIRGTYYAYCGGYGSGDIYEKRHLESDYLKEGVYGNKISSVIDLLIHKPGMADGEYKAVSVSSDIVVKCCNYVAFLDSNGDTYYNVYEIKDNGEVDISKTNIEPNTGRTYKK